MQRNLLDCLKNLTNSGTMKGYSKQCCGEINVSTFTENMCKNKQRNMQFSYMNYTFSFSTNVIIIMTYSFIIGPASSFNLFQRKNGVFVSHIGTDEYFFHAQLCIIWRNDLISTKFNSQSFILRYHNMFFFKKIHSIQLD